ARIRQRLKRDGVFLVQPGTLRVQPALELSAVSQVEAVQQRSREQLERLLRLALVEQTLERADIARDDPGVQREVIARGVDGLRADRGAKDVEGIRQLVTGTISRALGPQQCDQLVARDRAPAREYQHREQTEAVTLRRAADDEP